MLIIDTAERFRQLLATNPAFKTPNMNQQCKVCNEPAAGFHFGAFTCEGCKRRLCDWLCRVAVQVRGPPRVVPYKGLRIDEKGMDVQLARTEAVESFFGRTYNNLGSISECKNNGECVINKKNRTSCKACRLRKCLLVGMSKSGSRYGRRSNWFKIHCLLQEQGASFPPFPKEEPLLKGDQAEDEAAGRRASPAEPGKLLPPLGFAPYPRPAAPLFLEPWPREKGLASPSPGVLPTEQEGPIDLSVKRHPGLSQTSESGVLDLTKRQALTS